MSLIVGDALTVLRTLPAERVQTCITSPPYWGLRDYGMAGQIGLETTPEEYVSALVAVFGEVLRVLREDGTLWLNLGDVYANDGKWGGETGGKQAYLPDADRRRDGRDKRITGLKPKDLVGIPWTVAFALRAQGWWLRSDIIWAKPNPMPESVTDRPTKAHEYLFLLAKGERYYYDAEAIKEPASYGSHGGLEANPGWKATATGNHSGSLGLTPRQRESKKRGEFNGKTNALPGREAFRAITDMRNRRSVWTVATQPYPEAHFATFPPDLIKPCVLAGSRVGDTVLDPFAGAGTTLYVAKELGRQAIGIELNPAYVALAERRTRQEVLPL